jgi:glutathione S-transferase
MKLMKDKQPTIVLCELGETGIPNVQSYSPFCLKVHRALGLAGLDYTSRRGAPHDFRALDPRGQVPVLLVDDEVIGDSTEILARIDALAVRRGGASLVPADARARAEAWLWEDYADRALNGYLVAARWADPRNWPLVREAYFKGAPWLVKRLVVPMLRRKVISALVARDFLRAGEKALWDDFRRVLDCLEARAPLDGFWLGGEAVTVAHRLAGPRAHASPGAHGLARPRRCGDVSGAIDGPVDGRLRARHDPGVVPFTYPYPRPSVTADVVAFTMRADDLAVLLIKRKADPFKGCWALPGGFVNENEPLDRAAARELHEETGLIVHPSKLEQLGAFGDPGRDPRGHTVTVAFVTFRATETAINPGDDAIEAAWHPLRALGASASAAWHDPGEEEREAKARGTSGVRSRADLESGVSTAVSSSQRPEQRLRVRRRAAALHAGGAAAHLRGGHRQEAHAARDPPAPRRSRRDRAGDVEAHDEGEPALSLEPRLALTRRGRWLS